jgi:hypothetical protein
MSDELAAETPDAAIRAYLFAIGFTLVLIGGEMMAEKPDPRFYTGLILVILGLPVHLSWVFWKKLKPWLGTSQLSEASAIATSVRWWLGILLVFWHTPSCHHSWNENGRFRRNQSSLRYCLLLSQ